MSIEEIPVTVTLGQRNLADIARSTEEKGKREFFFSCDDVLTRDKWMIAIDFLKTKAVYDAYSRKNRDV